MQLAEQNRLLGSEMGVGVGGIASPNSEGGKKENHILPALEDNAGHFQI